MPSLTYSKTLKQPYRTSERALAGNMPHITSDLYCLHAFILSSVLNQSSFVDERIDDYLGSLQQLEYYYNQRIKSWKATSLPKVYKVRSKDLRLVPCPQCSTYHLMTLLIVSLLFVTLITFSHRKSSVLVWSAIWTGWDMGESWGGSWGGAEHNR